MADLAQAWTDLLGSSELEGPTSSVRRTESPTSRAAATPPGDEIALLRAPAHERESAALVAALSDLGQVSVRDLASLGDLGYAPPSLAILVGSTLDLPAVVGVLSGLRAEVDERALPILALGLAATEDEIVRVLAAGACESLSLPARPGELRAKVRRLLERRRKRALPRPPPPRAACGSGAAT